MTLLAAGALLAAAAFWVVARPAPAGPALTAAEPTAGLAVRAGAAVPDPAPAQPAATSEVPRPAAYLEQLAAAKRAFVAEPRDAAWAARAEPELRAAVAAGMAAGATHTARQGDLQVECRTRHCRLSVPIPAGGGVASLPVAAAMAAALQRAAPAIDAHGRIVAENVEATADTRQRRYALYLRRHEASPDDRER